jgi:pimeloyl-ACP methyl ester carboxylesterase
MLHGLNDWHLTWRRVAPALATKRRLLMPDLAGHGRSERPNASYELTWHSRLIAKWFEAIGLQRVDVLGHSLGIRSFDICQLRPRHAGTADSALTGAVLRSIALARRSTTRGVLVAASLALGACGSDKQTNGMRACTEIGCVDGLSLPFSRPFREPGSYRLTLELDGASVTCQATLPFAGCTGGGSCSAPQVLLEQSGCALPSSEHTLTGLRITSTPANVRVRVDRDGAPVATGDFSPTYTRSQPNGEGCPPICQQASATLVVP